MELAKIDELVYSWMQRAREIILTGMQCTLTVTTKTSRNDLVTNMDRQVEQFYYQRIKATFPASVILGEEAQHHPALVPGQGMLWVIDPIDGTMNFVRQRTDFATMIALFVNGRLVRGYILDVPRNELFWGGPGKAVYRNKQQLAAPENVSLKDGLVQVSNRFILNDYAHSKAIINASSGLRVFGSAGISFIHLLTGRCILYMAKLKPWDFLPGVALAMGAGLQVGLLDNRPAKLEAISLAVTTPAAWPAIQRIMYGE
ncbi:inositol monophosphatase family protein [Ligilactobacillus sp. LYQ60]|uniref:inositol monophosphatase family protein n=1 Tax=unclassified Ligilactobacillus TaxID=2767920 RepID=UPI0038544738